MKDEECMFRDFLNGGFSLSCLVIHVATFSFAILYIMTSRASLRLSSSCAKYNIVTDAVLKTCVKILVPSCHDV